MKITIYNILQTNDGITSALDSFVDKDKAELWYIQQANEMYGRQFLSIDEVNDYEEEGAMTGSCIEWHESETELPESQQPQAAPAGWSEVDTSLLSEKEQAIVKKQMDNIGGDVFQMIKEMIDEQDIDVEPYKRPQAKIMAMKYLFGQLHLWIETPEDISITVDGILYWINREKEELISVEDPLNIIQYGEGDLILWEGTYYSKPGAREQDSYINMMRKWFNEHPDQVSVMNRYFHFNKPEVWEKLVAASGKRFTMEELEALSPETVADFRTSLQWMYLYDLPHHVIDTL